jgi:hypothetical protein
MEVKETAFLKVIADLSFPDKKIVINPNDGFDLGLMMTDATVLIYYGHSPATIDNGDAKPVYGNVYQANECKLGTVELSAKAVEKIGSPKNVRLHLIPQDTYPKVLIETQ